MRTVRTGGTGPFDGVVFETPDDMEVELAAAPSSGRRRTRGEAAERGDDVMLAALAESGLTPVADARLRPAARAVRAEAEPTRIRVEVAPSESAVVLVETGGGTFTWVQPDPAPTGRRATRGTGPATLTFTLGGPGPARPARTQRSVSGWLIEKITKPVRTLVLKFVVRGAIDLAIAHIEGGNATGLVRIADADPAAWQPGGALPPAPEGRPMRVLLLVHGTFSSTSGSFGHLTKHPAGRHVLQEMLSRYDAVLGFDHKTLAESVEENARQMAEALARLPADAEIDAIAYSRGGLVLRALFDEALAAAARSDLSLRRAVFVGCTNAGTHLAKPDNWEALADLYTNVIMAGARLVSFLAGGAVDPLVRLGIRTIGEFVQMLPQVAVRDGRVPGLASMEPGGKTVHRLAGIAAGGHAAYHAITSNFAPHFEPSRGLTNELAQLLLDRVTNDLWKGEPNDLVVDTRSMITFGARDGGLTPERTYAFGNVETIYHTVYFTAPETCERLIAWLDLPPLPAEIVVTRRTRRIEPSPDLAPPRSFSPPLSYREVASRPPSPARRSSRRAVAIDRGVEWPPQPEPELEAAAPEAAPCHVAASMPETPSLGKPALLEVTLSREEIAKVAGEAHANAVIELAAGADLTVRVTARANCEIVGPNAERVRAPGPGAPEVLGFEVQGHGPGPAEVWADIYQGARRLTRLVLQPVFVTPGEIAASAVVSPKDIDPPIVDLRILEEGSDDEWRLRFLISAPELDVEDEYVSDWQRIDKTEYIASLYKGLEDRWADTKGEFEALMELVRADGADLFRGLFPEAMQRRIWNLRNHIGSLQVFAQEPSIPWEIAFIAEPGKPLSPAEGKFLAEFGLTRWITNVGVAPARLRLRPGKTIYCVPEYLEAGLNLPSQPDEIAMLQDLLDAQPVEPHIGPVLALLRRTDGQDFDALHFACHGSADPKRIWESGLLLQGFERDGQIAREELTVKVIANNANLARDGVKPIVYLNACQTSVGGYGLSGAGGLAQAFVRQGAGLLVGTLWSVEDGTALIFSTTFYEHLKAGKTVVQSAKAAREAARANHESTWLAYSVYGHPYARASA